jgi:regulator of PEP synthase PpsR (kinase-PPPase family)
MKKAIIHLISDSSGQTVKYAAKSTTSQFVGIEFKEYNWPMIRNKELLNEVLSKIRKKPGIILYTLSSSELRQILKNFCYELKVPCVSVISHIVKEFSAFIGTGTDNNLEYTSKLDDSYFDKVEAIDYTLRHDDGQMQDVGINEADIILIGPSRTSKTPTSVYLAYNGFKTANIPYVYGCPFPDYLKNITNILIVGLIINPAILIEIRETRMNLLQVAENNSYTDIKVVQDECLQVKRICEQLGWPVIDVSRKSIEETAAVIMKIYYDKKNRSNFNK